MEELEENDIINIETLIDIAETKFTLANFKFYTIKNII